MLGTIVNCITVIIGGSIGLLAKRGISERISSSIMSALALCVMYIGIDGALKGQNVLIVIVSMAIGALIGELLDLDGRIERLGKRIETRVAGDKGDGSLARGFVAASLLFCVGAMSVVGSLESGISGNHHTLFAKSLIDGIAGAVLASTMGAGVILSSVFVLVYQGTITLASGFLKPILTEVIINEMTCTGSLMIIGLSLNMLGLTKLKVMNYIPAMFIPIIIYWVMSIGG